MDALVLNVRLHDRRYHGEGDWPPAPARLFQALVAGAGLSGPLGAREQDALRWLENLPAPIIAAPRAQQVRRGVLLYMPNNDSDSIAGDPARMAKIRTATKVFRPHVFDGDSPFVYAWSLPTAVDVDGVARTICSLTERLYQLGRGIDMAWAWAEFLDADAVDAFLAQYPGCVYRPSASSSALTLLAPLPGSLDSIERRYRAYAERFHYMKDGRKVKVVFRQPPRPRFQRTAYESPPSRRVYELRRANAEAGFAPWRLSEASVLVVRLRDAAVEQLKGALPAHAPEIERVLVGRKPDGTNDGPTTARVRIVPLPSIGHPHADRAIRRVAVEVPAECPLRADDVHWAFSGLEPFVPDTGELLGVVMTPTEDEGMLARYGIVEGSGWRTWRSVTPVVLPGFLRAGTMGRVETQAHATAAVARALRHAGHRLVPETIRVQHEPFDGRGERAEAFASGTRFARDRLWHVEITFSEPIRGPLVIGDGRFLGLGVMRPVERSHGIHAFVIDRGLSASPDPTEIARALRRAVMARVQDTLGPQTRLPAFFCGHELDGKPARAERSPHLTFLFDPGQLGSARLMVVAPHTIERRDPTRVEAQHLRHLDAALAELHELRAGSSGRLMLRTTVLDPGEDPLFAPSRHWESVTDYQVTRHVKHVGAEEALAADLRTECRRCGLPTPLVSPLRASGVRGAGLVGAARLTFEVAVRGPVVLGRSRYLGGGLFASAR